MADNMAIPEDFPIPPASFELLVESILMQAQMQLGLLKLSEEEEDMPANLPLAKHSIDMLAMLLEKTRGNLTDEEQRLLENGMTELRFRYVQAADEQKRAGGARSSQESPADRQEPLIITADGGKGTKTD
jgi:hypothetical protein